jgi:transposase
LARLDRKRPKKGRNTEWRHPHDPDARITKMKDGRTHLAHKAEHAVDMDTGAIVSVTVQGADQGDTTTIAETVTAAAEDLEAVAAVTDGETAVIDEVVADKGYHSNQVLVDLAALDLRTYIAEPNRGRRNWTRKAAARSAVYANRRRIRGGRGRALQRRRSERLERPNAHLYETGGMRRTHLRGHTNILKRLLVHSGGFNLGLVMRTLVGVGTPRGLQGRLAALIAVVIALWTQVVDRWCNRWTPSADHSSQFTPHYRFERFPVVVSEGVL